jgi:ABC-2 type transport system permease protein
MTGAAATPTYPRPSTLATAWLIARRAALESLRDRSTLVLSIIFALALPTFFALGAVRPEALHARTGAQRIDLGATMALYLLIVGLGPSSSASSVAAGVFAGEMEKGNLAPLLATPASNLAIFLGKIAGAVLPACLYAAIAEAIFLTEVALAAGPDRLRLLPVSLSAVMLLLVPALATLNATLASLISSRARTYTGAQTVAGLLLVPIMAVLVGIAYLLRYWGPWWPFAVVAALVAIDALLIARGAATWRREEVLARR